MQKLIGIAIAIAAVVTPAAAHADIASISGRAQLGLDGSAPAGFELDGSRSMYGAATGLRLSARVLFVEAYWDRQSYHGDGALTRAVLGVRSDYDVWKTTFIARAGLGTIHERGGVLGGAAGASSRGGATARAGLALEMPLGYGLRLGTALDTEAYVAKPSDASWSDDMSDTGTTYIGSLYLALQLGI